jgi:hypothetical protein
MITSKEKYKIYNNIIIKYDELSKSDFDLSPVWVEQNSPLELEYVKKNDIPEEWIEQYFYEEVTNSENPYYTILGDYQYYKKAEFVYIGCLIHYGDSFFHGYITLFANYITTIKFFHYGKTMTFYLNDMFDNYNVIFLNKLNKITNTSLSKFNVILKSKILKIKNNEKCLEVYYHKNIIVLNFSNEGKH